MTKFAVVYNNSYADTVTQNFKSFLDDELYIDLVFVCRNNKKIGAHQIVMGCISKLFYSMFIENSNTTREKVMHVYVPDIRAKIMKLILKFIYCGTAMLNKEELAEFNEDIKLLGMPLDLFTPIDEVQTAVGSKNTPVPSDLSQEKVTDTPPVATSSNAAVMPKQSSTVRLNEAVAPTSTPSATPLSAPLPLLTSESKHPLSITHSSGICNVNMTPGLPVITSVHALKPNTNINSFNSSNNAAMPIIKIPSPLAVMESTVPPIDPSRTPVPPNEISKPVTRTRVGRKRKRNKIATNAEPCITLDSDDENDVIMIS